MFSDQNPSPGGNSKTGCKAKGPNRKRAAHGDTHPA